MSRNGSIYKDGMHTYLLGGVLQLPVRVDGAGEKGGRRRRWRGEKEVEDKERRRYIEWIATSLSSL